MAGGADCWADAERLSSTKTAHVSLNCMAQILSRVQQIDEALSNFLRPDSRGRLSPHESLRSHPVVIRPPAAFGRHPGNDLVGVGDVTGLAVNAVRGVQGDA